MLERNFYVSLGFIYFILNNHFFRMFDKDKNLREECFYLLHKSFKLFTVNYVCDDRFNVVTSPRRIKIRDKPTINKARTHNSSGIKTRLPVYRKLNLALRIWTNGSHNHSYGTGKDLVVFLSNSIINTGMKDIPFFLFFFSMRQFYRSVWRWNSFLVVKTIKRNVEVSGEIESY
jgi:hypothetical protein